jgi:hypothetical protein
MRRHRTALLATGVLAGVLSLADTASAAPTACADAGPTYGVGIAITPEFVGTDEIAVAAYPGEQVDYDVVVFLAETTGTNPVTVCPIFDGTVTLTLPDGSGPFTIATGVSLPVGGRQLFENVPATAYTVDPADATGVPLRLDAVATISATSDGLDDGPDDDQLVTASTAAPTFIQGASTRVGLTPNPTAVGPGQPVTWTVTETNDTPPEFFQQPLADVRVELSVDGGATAFATLTSATAGFTGDTNGDSLLDPGETWTWVVETRPSADVTVTATGFGSAPRGRVITYPADLEERTAASVSVTTLPPITGTLPRTGPSAPPDRTAAAAGMLVLAGLALVVLAAWRRGAAR